MLKRFFGIIIIGGCVLGSVPISYALTPAPHFWSQRFGSTSSDRASTVTTDGSGNVIVGGRFQGTVDFGGGNLVSTGDYDIFVAKFSAAGVHQWSMRLGNNLPEGVVSVAVDDTGNIVLAGSFQGIVNFGGGNLTSAGAYDIFLAKYDINGVHQWSKRVGGLGNDAPAGVAVDTSGNIVLTGSFGDTVDFGGGGLVAAGLDDIFVAEYNAAGTHQWSQSFGSTGIDEGYGVGVDAVGNVLVIGHFAGTVDFGGGNLVSAGIFDIFVARYDAAGTHVWSQRFGSSGIDIGYSVAVDGFGNILMTGAFNGTVDFGGGNLVSQGSSDVVIAKYDATGAHQWSERFGGTTGDIAFSLAADASGNTVLAGYFEGTANFGGSNLVSAGGLDMFVARYDATGAHQWSQRFGSTLTDYAIATMDGAGSVVVTGYFGGTVDFGGGSLASAGSDDIIVAKFGPGPAEPLIGAVTDIGNDQGRQAKVEFKRSGYDEVATPSPIQRYEAYRRTDPAPAAASGWRGPSGVSKRELLLGGWTEVGSVSAHGESEYSIDVPTIGDSTVALGQYYSVFFIRAATADPFTYYDSPPDSGYSLDNLAPGVPMSFAYNGGILTWDESQAADFDYFSVYGSNTNTFGSATLIDYTVATAMNVTSSPHTYYFVTATDFSGNEGTPATLNAATGVGDTPGQYVLSISAYPNPFNPNTVIRYTVPSNGPVEVGLYDVSGARVATLVNQNHVAGAYTERWDGLDTGGKSVSSGVYFAKVTHPSGTRTYKLVLLK